MSLVAGPVARRVLPIVGIVLVGLAIATSAFLGSVGWWAVGFGVMTDCTNNYSCSDTGCSPCDAASRWLTVGALSQLGLGIVSVIVLVRGVRSARRHVVLPIAGALLLAGSVSAIAVTTTAAQASYCRMGSPGYAESHCSVGG